MKFTIHEHPGFPRNAIMIGYFPSFPNVTVQPMSRPLGLLFYLDYRFDVQSQLTSLAAQEIANKIDYGIEGIENDYVDLERFPDKCLRCGMPAYVGLNDVDCSKGCM